MLKKKKLLDSLLLNMLLKELSLMVKEKKFQKDLRSKDLSPLRD